MESIKSKYAIESLDVIKILMFSPTGLPTQVNPSSQHSETVAKFQTPLRDLDMYHGVAL